MTREINCYYLKISHPFYLSFLSNIICTCIYRFSINNTLKNSLEMKRMESPINYLRHLFPPQLLDNLFFIVEILAFLSCTQFP